ncbi:MAG: HEAT repeat domain-containing protein [Candidatus Eisenbacteria bacterium]
MDPMELRLRNARVRASLAWFALLAVALPAGRPAPAAAAEAIAGLDSLASHTLLRAMDVLEISRAELGFDKLYAPDDTFRLPLIETLLLDPLAIPAWQTETVCRIRGTLDEDWTRLPSLLGSPLVDVQPCVPVRPSSPERQPPAGPDAVIERFIRSCRATEADLERAFRDFEPDEITRLLVLAPAFWGDEKDPADRAKKGRLHFERGAQADTTIEISSDPILDLAAKMDRAALISAAARFTAALDSLVEGVRIVFALPAQGATETGPMECINRRADGRADKILRRWTTPWGDLAIGGWGPNRYEPEFFTRTAFLLDLGGDDDYRGRAASAIGFRGPALSALVDFAGDDRYGAEGYDYALGGALLGLAALIDEQGNDVYRGADGCLGAGFFGFGLLLDAAGVDFFSGGNFCQGAGGCGIGVLLSLARPDAPPGMELDPDRAFEAGWVAVPGTGAIPVRHDDNDLYRCARQSQGFGSTFGVGLLYDRAGSDDYCSGGRYRHVPLLPNDFQSLAQGFAIGFRPRAAGGIGLLLDEQGNDLYNAEVYAQGVSCWYSLGLLFDGGGNDLYRATQYAQGAGVHLAIGSLWDRGGDDQYVSRLGVTQGTAHDLSAGWLLDESGNDSYLVSDGQGMSITNSVAVFVDGQGDDTYATRGAGQAALTWARGFAGAALFLDLEGRDTYPRDRAGGDGAVWSGDLHAIGIDLDRDLVLPGEVVPEIHLTREDSSRAIPELFETASLWEVGSAREKVRRARQALVARGGEAIDYACAEKLGTREGLEFRTLSELGKAHPDSFAECILARLRDENVQVRRNGIALLGELAWRPARGPLTGMLGRAEDEEHWTRVIQSLGMIGDRAAAPDIRPFLEDREERRRIASVVALAALRDTFALPAMVACLNDSCLTVRAAAAAAIAGFPAPAAGLLIDGLSGGAGGTGPARRSAWVETLARVASALADSAGAGAAAARRALVDEFTGPAGARTAWVRAAAVRALIASGDLETIALVGRRIEGEGDPLVLRTYRLALEARRSAGEP